MKDASAQDNAHDLMPDSLAAEIPPLGATENETDPTIHAKFFTPDTSWTWYVIEYDPKSEEKLCFGLVDGLDCELGYFSLSEIQEVRGPLGLPVERDLYWSPTRLSEVTQELDRSRGR